MRRFAASSAVARVVRPRAAVAPLAATVTAAPAPPPAAPPPPPPPPAPAAPAAAATTAALVAGAHRGQLLRCLAGDLRVVGQSQPDAAALAVDLDHADLELLAAIEHVLDGVDALAGRDV